MRSGARKELHRIDTLDRLLFTASSAAHQMPYFSTYPIQREHLVSVAQEDKRETHACERPSHTTRGGEIVMYALELAGHDVAAVNDCLRSSDLAKPPLYIYLAPAVRYEIEE